MPKVTSKVALGTATTDDIFYIVNNPGGMPVSNKITFGNLVKSSNIINQIVNVKDYGAIGDGLTDDSISIQNAINDAETAGGGIVNFPVGTFNFGTNGLTPKDNVILRGVGIDATILLHGNVTNGLFYTAVPLIGFGIEGMTINAQGYTTICLYQLSHCHFNNVKFYDAASQVVGYASGEDILFDNCIFLNPDSRTTSFQLSVFNGTTISKCDFTVSGYEGISVYSNCNVLNCTFKALATASRFAIVVHGPNATISKNNINWSSGNDNAITVYYNATDIKITDNIITGNNSKLTKGIMTGFGASYPTTPPAVTRLIITGNQINGGGSDGIIVWSGEFAPTPEYGGTNIIISNNIVSDITGEGLLYGVGIEVHGRYILIEGNIVTGCVNSGIFADTIHSIIKGNICIGNGIVDGDGIWICNSDNIVMGNTCLNNGASGGAGNDSGILLGVNGFQDVHHIAISDNHCFNTDGGTLQAYGIRAYNFQGNTVDYLDIHNNDVQGNRINGIFLEDGTAINLIIHDNTGYLTRNYGAEIDLYDGNEIVHSLITTPTYAKVSASIAGEIVTITSLDTEYITVAIKKPDGSAGTEQTIYWEAEV